MTCIKALEYKGCCTTIRFDVALWMPQASACLCVHGILYPYMDEASSFTLSHSLSLRLSLPPPFSISFSLSGSPSLSLSLPTVTLFTVPSTCKHSPEVGADSRQNHSVGRVFVCVHLDGHVTELVSPTEFVKHLESLRRDDLGGVL